VAWPASRAVVLSIIRDERWAHLAGAVVVGGTLVSALMMATVQLPPPGYAVDPATGIPTGELFPGYLRLLTPFFNITGAFLLVLGALYSAYIFMPKRRVIRYALDTSQGPVRFAANLPHRPHRHCREPGRIDTGATSPSWPGDFERVPATILIAIGGLILAITDGLNRFGTTSALRRPAAWHHLPIPRLPCQHRVFSTSGCRSPGLSWFGATWPRCLTPLTVHRAEP
jgi:hypothetical protein